MARSLQEVLEQLRSDKIKDRQQGIEALEHIFADHERVLGLDPKQDGKPWLKTFQALFACVLADKGACIKKGSFQDAQPVALARLGRSAQMLRSLVEMSAALLTRKVVKALVTHIVQMINHRGSLLRPIASAYMSALCAILKHQHHVDHLDPEDWRSTAFLCFDVLLGRDLDASPSTVESSEWLTSVSTASPSVTQRRGLSLDDAVTAGCLRHLVTSTTAPLLSPDGHGLDLLADYTRFFLAFPLESSAHLPAMRGLVVLLEHLELNYTQQVACASLALRHVVLALWRTKNHLLKVQLLLYFRICVPLLSSCASGQSGVASAQSSISQQSFRAETITFLELVHDSFLRDPDTRWALNPMKLDHIVFHWPQHDAPGPSRQPSMLSNSAFCLAPHSSEQGSLAWCRISLQMDIIDALVTLESVYQTNSTPALLPSARDNNEQQQSMEVGNPTALHAKPSNGKRAIESPLSSPQKRRRTVLAERIHDHRPIAWVQQLVETITHAGSTPNFGASAKLGALQLLVFLLLTKPGLVNDATLGEARQGLLALAADTDSLLVSWSLVGLGAIAIVSSSDKGKVMSVGSQSTDSSYHGWSIAARKLQFKDTCRASAFLLSVIVAEAVSSEDILQPEISRLVAEVDLQGPPVLCDSVCHLMTLLLRNTTSSRIYQHLESRRKIGSWFANSYSPGNASLLSSQGVVYIPYHDLSRLASHIIADEASDCMETPRSYLHGDDVTELLRRRSRLQPLRDLTFGSFDTPRATSDAETHVSADPSKPSLISTEAFNRMLVTLDRKIDTYLDVLTVSDTEVDVTPDISFQVAMTMMHTALLTIDVRSRAASYSSSQHTARVKCCCQVILRVVTLASQAKTLQGHERILVFQQLSLLDTLNVSQADDVEDDTRANELLTSPGEASGLASACASSDVVSRLRGPANLDDRVKRSWIAIREAGMLEAMLASWEALLEDILCGDVSMGPNTTPIAESSGRDAFDNAPESSTSSNLRAKGSTSDTSIGSMDSVVKIIVPILAGVPRMMTQDADSRRDELIVSLFFDCPVRSMIPMAPVVFDLFHRGSLWMSKRDLVDALNRLGADLLTDYRYARLPAARTAAVRAVTAVIPLLAADFDEQSDLFDKVKTLGAFFADQIGRAKWPTSWEVQIACARFLAVYLKSDPGGCLGCSRSAHRGMFAPVSSLLSITTDVDIRVRALGSPIAAVIFDTPLSDEEQLSQLYTDFRDNLPSDASIPQHILTRALSLCNVAIASSAVRRSALFHLLEIVLATGMLHETVQHLFAQVAAKLGFPDPSSCYQAFAGQITWGMVTNNYDPLQVPWKVLGFASKRDCLEATFTASGSMLLAAQTNEGRTQFETIVQLTRRTQQQGLQECLPFLTAAYLGFAVHAAQQQGPRDVTEVAQQTLHELSLLGFAESENHNLRDMIARADDLVVVSLLVLYFEPASSLSESRRSAITALTQHDAKSGKILTSLSPISDSLGLVLHEPSRPFFTSDVICAALSVMPILGIEPFRKDVVYNVLRHTFHHVASSRFHNDQLRLCAGLRIYVAMCGDSFWMDQLSTRILIQSVEQLLHQRHLHDELQPILTYACHYSSLAQHCPEVLVSCVVSWSAEIADQLAETPTSGDWLLEAARAVAKASPVATSATVLLWPANLTSTETRAIEGLIDIDTVAFAIKACPHIALQLASLQRIRTVLRKTDKTRLEVFCREFAYKLLERMADCLRVDTEHTTRVSQSDFMIDIYGMIANVGESALLQPKVARFPGCGQAGETSAEEFLTAVDTSQTSSLAAATVLVIHGLTNKLPLEAGYLAFQTLRSIAALVDGPLTSLHPHKTLPAIGEELDRIRPSINSDPFSDVASQSALLDEDLIDAAISSDRWICRISANLCDLVSNIEPRSVLRPVGRFVSKNPVAAQALFHVLLLWFSVTDLEPAANTLTSAAEKRSRPRRSEPQGQRSHSLGSCRMAIATHFKQVLTSRSSDPACSAIIVQALLTLRSLRPVPAEPDKVCFWYPVDNYLLAKRCLACGLYSAAIFFVEHGTLEQEDSQASLASQARDGTELLHKAYMNIDDPDAFYGIQEGDVRELLLKRLHHEGQWLRAFQYHGADYEASTLDGTNPSRPQTNALAQSLSSLGFRNLAKGVDSASGAREVSSRPALDGSESVDSVWDLPIGSNSASTLNNRVDLVLKTLRQASVEQSVDEVLSQAVQAQLQSFCSIPAESLAAKRRLQGDLLSLGQVKDWRKASTSLGPEEAVAHLRSVWTRVDVGGHYEVTERVLKTRQAVLETARERMQCNQIGDVLDGAAEQVARVERLLLIQLSRHGREHEKLQQAINATARAERIESLLGDGANLAREEFASVLWDQNEHSPAIKLLSQIVDDLAVTTESSVQQRRRGARLLALLAQWRATTRSQHPRKIDGSLFDPALKIVATLGGPNAVQDPSASVEASKIAYRWARFAEEHHRGSDAAEITRLRRYIQSRVEEIGQNQRECERTNSKTEKSKLLQFQHQAAKMLRQDETRLTELEASRTHFLRRSVVMYARALSSSDVHDDAAARLVSLWFENANDAEVNRLLTSCLNQIPSRKFVPLMHQLSARLTEVLDQSDSMAPFQRNLTDLLLRMCQDHPFHCLYAIFALIKTGADAKAASNHHGRRSSLALPVAGPPSQSPQILRSAAADKIWNQIKRRTALARRLKTFENLCLAYVEWAEFDLTSRPDRYFQSNGSIKKGALRMPPSGELRLSSMRNLDVPVATAHLDIDPTCRYETFVSIVRYSETFTTAGGIHLPKISGCIGSDGKRYKQLFKRDDDLRQDAVMQQVFRMVNELLQVDRRTRERKLCIRTYTVLPLGPQCGLLEFVTNTVPLGTELIALHARHRPNDITSTEARKRIRDAQALPAEAKLEAFLDVCEQMRPAFRYFFSDAQRMPRDWYETRSRYTRSVSTNSIVGHVLGLGDRHVSNILLDTESGELVHIDFGVAFDQGKLLPVPELVPFRLTRDVVDGMGIHGVEGTFRRCCEETLRVLRAHQDVIKTVLEVFRHDPLFAWTSNPIKVLREQEDNESIFPAASMERAGSTADASRSTPAPSPVAARAQVSRSTTPFAMPAEGEGVLGTDTVQLSADRAVNSVLGKLSSSLSIEYTVNDLIQQAMDAGNLSAIFHGWQAAL